MKTAPEFKADFIAWYQRYPRKVGRLAAQKAYEKARRTHGATQDELLAGIDAYMRHKPDYADFAHPATWLNQGRWMDEYRTVRATAHQPSGAYDWLAECQRLHQGECQMSKSRHDARMDAEGAAT